MTRRNRLPTPDEHDRLWRTMELAERRRVLRHVRRGQAAESRRHARVAVGIARQQQRYWRWAWLLGPAVAILFAGRGVVPVLAYATAGLLGMGGLSLWSIRRARRSELANLERLGLGGETPA